MTRTAVVAGVGPGLGASLARTFAEEGCAVGLFARSEGYIAELAADIEAEGGEALAVPTDVSDGDAVRAGFEAVRDAFGPIDVLVCHAEHYVEGGLLELPATEFEAAWRGTVGAAFHCARAAVPDMLDGDGGTVLFTGASFSVRGEPGVLGPASAKFGARGLAESLAREFGPQGVHVAHVTIDGPVDTPERRENHPEGDPAEWLDPDAVARTYWHLVEQDRSAWSFEVDLRPDSEPIHRG
jgi:NAD(P)-dependent dehydrogenase (short-subunit alcohol dehydrogenase family)